MTLIFSGTYHPRQIVLTAMLVVSRLWLAGFLLYRVMDRGHDARFDEMRQRFFAFLGFWVFQMLWVWIVSMPVVYANSRPVQPAWEARDTAGVVIFGELQR
jgi:steroid 5-alpha reductase family enzyme